MPVDFSHIIEGLKANGYRSAIERCERVTDEMFYDAVAALHPPPLPCDLMTQLLRELDEKLPRKPGRPQLGAVTCKRLANAIEALSNESMPDLLRSSLLSRLGQGYRYTEFERSEAYGRRIDKLDRDMFIRGLYRDFLPAIQAGDQLVHEVLGPIDESCALENDSPSQKTLAIVADIMGSKKWGLHPPSMRRMQNIIYKKTQTKNVHEIPC